MMKHKTSELTGALLDTAVAKAEGWAPYGQGFEAPALIAIEDGKTLPGAVFEIEARPWSSSWIHGGPIIERERISVVSPDSVGDYGQWKAFACGHVDFLLGSTPIEAAMRAYVASKLGEEVEL
jgi:hypothetical protein